MVWRYIEHNPAMSSNASPMAAYQAMSEKGVPQAKTPSRYSYSAQSLSRRGTPKMTLESAKPFVYIALDHIEPRPPVEANESHTGLWLRIVNNSVFPIEVVTMGANTDPELTLVADEVIGRFTRIDPNDPPHGTMPAGYSASIGSPEIIAPGKKHPVQRSLEPYRKVLVPARTVPLSPVAGIGE